MSTYLSFSLKRYLEHGTFVKLLETKGLKLLCNVKTKWISMLSLMKQVLAEYKILMVKMHDDLYIYYGSSKDQPPIFCDIEVVSMGLACIMFIVATLALGSRPRQRLARVRAKREARNSHLMLLGM
jgi:hypothetical protein